MQYHDQFLDYKPSYVLLIKTPCSKEQQKESKAINSSSKLEEDYGTQKMRSVNILLY
jgi:hypothetical protein